MFAFLVLTAVSVLVYNPYYRTQFVETDQDFLNFYIFIV